MSVNTLIDSIIDERINRLQRILKTHDNYIIKAYDKINNFESEIYAINDAFQVMTLTIGKRWDPEIFGEMAVRREYLWERIENMENILERVSPNRTLIYARLTELTRLKEELEERI